jgi:formate dehydrogenase alpha subunit
MNHPVRLTFNGKEIEVEKGTLLIEAAKVAGAELPHFCYHPKLKYDANCRMCIVEIEKMPKLQTSCSTVVTEGMVVRSNTGRVKEAQNGVMAFLLGNHPLDCPECDQGGECQLQDFAHRHSPTVGSFDETKRVFEKEYFGPLIEKEMNRCVSCLRCVRYCDEVIGANALGSIDRGSMTEIGGFAHHPLDCEFCGGCIQICPVGALTSRASMYDYRPWQVKKTDTICTYCGDGCLITMETIDDKVIRTSSKLGVGRNEGDLCAKGFFGYGFINHQERLTRPIIVQNGKMQQVTWEWAVKKAATDFLAIKEKYGPAAIGGIIGAHSTNEEIYLFYKLMRDVIGTPHVDSAARYGDINATQALNTAFGTTRLARYEDIVGADLILSFAGDMTETNPICAIKVKEAVRKNKAKLIAIDAFNTQRDTYKSHLPHIASLHLQVKMGTEGAVILGLIKILAEATPGPQLSSDYLQRIKQAAESISFETIEAISGISRALLEAVAKQYAGASKAVLIVGSAITRNNNGYQNMMNIADLALLAGQVAKEGAGILALTDGPISGEPPAPVGREDAGVVTRGKTLVEIIDAVERGEIKALYIVGDNPIRSLPQKRVEAAFKKLELLICQELFMTETAAAADIILPAASFAEKEGHYTSQEGEVQKVRKAIDPIGNSKPDWAVFSLIAEKMDAPFGFKSVNDLWKERVVSLPPTPTSEEMASHMAAFCSAPRQFALPPAAPSDGAKDLFYLQVGKTLSHAGKMSTYADGLNIITPDQSVLIHPDDAERLGVVPGERIEIAFPNSDVESVQISIALSNRLAPGMLFLPEHCSMEIKRGLPLEMDPVTHVPYGNQGQVRLSKVVCNGDSEWSLPVGRSGHADVIIRK